MLSFVLACLLGAALLRLRGHYFAIASLSLIEVFRELVNNATDLTGGGMGLNIPLASRSGVMADATFFFYVMWGLLLATALMVDRGRRHRSSVSASPASGRTKPPPT